jgi:hypothetical protein
MKHGSPSVTEIWQGSSFSFGIGSLVKKASKVGIFQSEQVKRKARFQRLSLWAFTGAILATFMILYGFGIEIMSSE